MDDSSTANVSGDEQLRAAPPAPSPHVLLVLEDDLYASMLAGWLSKRGWRVTHAPRAIHALDAWRRSGAMVALVDLDADGLAALALLAAAKALRGTRRAVICTRDGTATELCEASRRRLGIEEVIVRPCHIAEVGAALARVAGVEIDLDAGDLTTVEKAS